MVGNKRNYTRRSVARAAAILLILRVVILIPTIILLLVGSDMGTPKSCCYLEITNGEDIFNPREDRNPSIRHHRKSGTIQAYSAALLSR